MVGIAPAAKACVVVAALARVASVAAVCGEDPAYCQETFDELCTSFAEDVQHSSGSSDMDAKPVKSLSETAWAALIADCPQCNPTPAPVPPRRLEVTRAFEPSEWNGVCPAGTVADLSE